MRKLLSFLLVISLPMVWLSADGQNYVCNGDSVVLTKPDVRGSYYWEKSNTGQDWTRMSNSEAETLLLIPSETSSYRLAIEEGACAIVYSSIVQFIHVSIPTMAIPIIHPTCENADFFLLQGEQPAGGKYVGAAIEDNRFMPGLAEVGDNEYYYIYEDLLSGCKDSIFGKIEVLPVPDIAYAGEDQLLVITDTITLSALTPAIGDGSWRIIEGQGGVLSDSTLATSTFMRGEEFGDVLLEWTVADACGISKDTIRLEFVQTSINPCPGKPFVFDQDGNRYKTIQIGGQCWMGENLKVGSMVESTDETRAHSNVRDNDLIEAYGWKNDLDSLNHYGGLYDWDEMMGYEEDAGIQGICPEGWHLPTREEWIKLDNYFVENNTGHALQVGGSSGFDAVLSGNRNARGAFYSLESSNFYWTSSTYTYEGANLGHYVKMVSCNEYMQWGWIDKKTGASVRCVQDN